ncbi:MAG TPA: hypothetical protein DDX19_09600 [Rhodopirellula baltica]|uniref:hypothetical protein n=1 Tax=Rhodopirellula baltica TaxID=265606 RepID=UPI0002E2B1C4|nr:hypothetical protein [Rhodopirellula baltica]HBE62979.1 hypothetical protein [Rhodopirellula baltica]
MPENPLFRALSDCVLGNEAFLKKSIAMAQSSDTQERQRTTRRLRAVTCQGIITETAAYEEVDRTGSIGFRSASAGCEIAALLCRRCVAGSAGIGNRPMV